jgi:hypothetical protein
VAAEDVGAGARFPDIAGEQQRDADRPHIGGADSVLGLAHAPDQGRGLLRRKHLGDALQLLARHARDALDLVGRPFLDFLAHIVEAVDALRNKLLVLPTVFDDVPHHAVEHRDVGARPQPHILGRVRGRARQPRIDDDDVCLVELGAL